MVGARQWIVGLSLVVAVLPAAAQGSVLRVAPRATAAAARPRAQPSRSSAVASVSFTSAVLQTTVAPHRQIVVARLVYGGRHPYRGRGALQRLRPSRRHFTVRWRISRLRPGTVYHAEILTVCACAGAVQRTRNVSFSTVQIGYENPVFGSFADPGTLAANSSRPEYYAYGTGNNFPITVSSDLVHWAPAGTALSARPAWVTRASDWHPWAPSVMHVDAPCPGSLTPGCYHMFYVGFNASLRPGANCVAVATSPTPGGPFTDQGILQTVLPSFDSHGRPPGCGDDAGYGYIDPSPYTDADGSTYLYVSTDWACGSPAGSPCHLQPTLSVVPLAPDGLHALTARQPLFAGRAHSWEAAGLSTPVVENPSLERHGNSYVLLYSGGSWTGAYGMGYAVATSPLGPFVRGQLSPFLAQTPGVGGPGGGATVIGPHGGEWLVYHARTPGSGDRTLRIDPFWWGSDGRAHMVGPTATPQATVP
jgi:glycosyl hydrolase family 43